VFVSRENDIDINTEINIHSFCRYTYEYRANVGRDDVIYTVSPFSRQYLENIVDAKSIIGTKLPNVQKLEVKNTEKRCFLYCIIILNKHRGKHALKAGTYGYSVIQKEIHEEVFALSSKGHFTTNFL
jgi:hypothetical protein